MTTTPTPRAAQSWQGDWRARLAERLASHGVASATAHAAARPSATLPELASLLGADVAPIQLRWLMLEEARASGPDALAHYARDLLARELRRYTPSGWNPGDDFKSGTFGAWAAGLPDEYESIALDVWEALLRARPPAGWTPAGTDDPLLVEAFRAAWPTSETP